VATMRGIFPHWASMNSLVGVFVVSSLGYNIWRQLPTMAPPADESTKLIIDSACRVFHHFLSYYSGLYSIPRQPQWTNNRD
jgi:hypothetical protein